MNNISLLTLNFIITKIFQDFKNYYYFNFKIIQYQYFECFIKIVNFIAIIIFTSYMIDSIVIKLPYIKIHYKFIIDFIVIKNIKIMTIED